MDCRGGACSARHSRTGQALSLRPPVVHDHRVGAVLAPPASIGQGKPCPYGRPPSRPSRRGGACFAESVDWLICGLVDWVQEGIRTHPVTRSSCHPVTLSPGHPLTPSPCLPVSLSPCLFLFFLDHPGHLWLNWVNEEECTFPIEPPWAVFSLLTRGSRLARKGFRRPQARSCSRFWTGLGPESGFWPVQEAGKPGREPSPGPVGGLDGLVFRLWGPPGGLWRLPFSGIAVKT